MVRFYTIKHFERINETQQTTKFISPTRQHIIIRREIEQPSDPEKQWRRYPKGTAFLSSLATDRHENNL